MNFSVVNSFGLLLSNNSKTYFTNSLSISRFFYYQVKQIEYKHRKSRFKSLLGLPFTNVKFSYKIKIECFFFQTMLLNINIQLYFVFNFLECITRIWIFEYFKQNLKPSNIIFSGHIQKVFVYSRRYC